MAEQRGRPTNMEFSKSNPIFIKACELAGLQPSQRQASKFRRGKGRAFAHKQEAQKEGE